MGISQMKWQSVCRISQMLSSIGFGILGWSQLFTLLMGIGFWDSNCICFFWMLNVVGTVSKCETHSKIRMSWRVSIRCGNLLQFCSCVLSVPSVMLTGSSQIFQPHLQAALEYPDDRGVQREALPRPYPFCLWQGEGAYADFLDETIWGTQPPPVHKSQAPSPWMVPDTSRMFGRNCW